MVDGNDKLAWLEDDQSRSSLDVICNCENHKDTYNSCIHFQSNLKYLLTKKKEGSPSRNEEDSNAKQKILLQC